MSTAVRVGVDLNSRCSRKCAAPATLAPSSRDPTPTQTPTDAECTDGMYSVTMRRPPGRVVLRTIDFSADSLPRLGLRRPALPLAACRGIDRRISGRGFLGCVFLGNEDEGDLAAVVDIGNLHSQLVPHLDHVFDLRNALAPAELGDVHQAVAAGKQRYERAEIRCLDHGSEEPL